WTADVLSLNAVIGQTAAVPTWVNPTPTVQQYEEAAWLMQQTGLWGNPTFSDQTNTANNVQNINEAIWNLMEFSGSSHPAGWTTGTGNNSAASWQADALAHYADMCGQTLCDQQFYSSVVILTPELNSQ